MPWVRYEAGLQAGWQAGDAVRSVWDGEWVPGVVERVEPEAPGDWEAVTVRWAADDGPRPHPPCARSRTRTHAHTFAPPSYCFPPSYASHV